MFEFLIHDSKDAIDLIKKDHENVKDLFDRFEKAETVREKKKIAADTILELKLHAAVEEEIFYPVVRKQIGKKVMNEADEEHHVVKVLIAELEEMDGTEDHYDAKYKVLSENVRHHIREEESDMLPKARVIEMDFSALGTQILARKTQLKKEGFAELAEEKMVAKSGGKGDSPAKAAKITKAAPKKTAAGKNSMLSKVVKISHAAKSLKTKAARTSKGNAKTKKLAALHKSGVMKKKTSKRF